MGYFCNNNNNYNFNNNYNYNNVPWECQAPQCQNQPYNIKQQCEQMGHFCGGFGF
jgi:hypothetical protein